MAIAYVLCDYGRRMQEFKHVLCVVWDNEELEISEFFIMINK